MCTNFEGVISMDEPVIISSCRTPVGTLLGDLSGVPAPKLGAVVVREALDRSGLDSGEVDEVIMGNVLSAGLGQAPARQAAIHAGIGPHVAALTINKVCGSSLKAVMLAAQAIKVGDARVIVAGGFESMSRAPHLLSGQRVGWKFGERVLHDSMLTDGLLCAFEGCHMGEQAEYIARKCHITREAQDRYAAESQRRATRATESGAFRNEIVPVEVPGRAGPRTITADQGVRPDTGLEQLAKLKPAFDKAGTVTAGNASQISDGAAALVVTTQRYADEHKVAPMARIVDYATAGVEPKEVFLAPVSAIRTVLAKTGMSMEDIDLFELNEAFAAQMLACMEPLNLPHDRLNIHGGAIALGHPLGASGARVLVTLLNAMEQRGAKRGLAALCLGGGNAVAMIVERPDS